MKPWLLLLSFIVLLSVLFPSENEISYLDMEKPSSTIEDKYSLQMDLHQIEKIISNYNFEGITANIEFADLKDVVQARLGKYEEGKIVWTQKIIEDKFLLVKFHRTYYKDILEKLQGNTLAPGYQILLSDAQTQIILKGYEITFSKLPDLAIDITYPIKISPGQPLNQEINVIIKNNGVLEAHDFEVDLILSQDKEMPSQRVQYSETFAEDVLLKNGRITIASLKPGENLKVNFKDPIMIPPNTPPDKYYLCAFIDAGNKIGELNKNNNAFQGFIMVDFMEPRKIIMTLKKTVLHFEPLTYDLQISSQEILLSDGKDWRKCRIKPYLYQLKHIGWENIHWEIDTLNKGNIWEVKGNEFCKTGGSAKEIKINLETIGGSKIALPVKFKLFLPELKLEYEPSTRKLNAIMFGNQIIYFPFWKVCKVSSQIYQFKHEIWKDFFLEINTQEKMVYKVTSGDFCKSGGTQEPLDILVLVE